MASHCICRMMNCGVVWVLVVNPPEGGGSKQQTGLQVVFLAADMDRGPVEIRTLSVTLPAARETGPPSVVSTPPSLLHSRLHYTTFLSRVSRF